VGAKSAKAASPIFFALLGEGFLATLIPSLNASLRRMTGGERRFAQRLVDKLEDDYTCWYDVPIGVAARHPDFVLLSPRRGVLILEVKDWKLETIERADKSQFTLHGQSGLQKVVNPFEQARQYAHAVVNLLQQDAQLQQTEGQYKGRLCVPFGYGVVLANITRKQFESAQLDAVIEPHRVICRDEMLENVEAEDFQKRLWGMFSVQFGAALTMPQIDRVRWHLFPEIRVQPEQLSLADVEPDGRIEPSQLPDLLRVMDMQQEQLARSLGEGHRVIHGVAGSGKTLILGFRCERLAPVLPKPVLVLCYNATLAAKLQAVIQLKKLDQKVSVRTFHGWCFDQLRLYNVVMPPKGSAYFDQLVEKVIHGVEKGQIPRAQYGAVMIDEGHDFRPDWLKLVAQMVDPETNSLLVLYDDAQSIYGGKTKRKFSFSSLGIQAQGRTTILRLNYRNTAEILGAAYEFAKEYIRPEQAEEDGVPLIQPESAGRRGLPPELRQFPTLAKEGSYLAEQFRQINKGGRPWRDMAVVYRTAFIGEEITKQLQAAKIPVQFLGGPAKKRFDPRADSVTVMTMHSSKGLEFPVVAIPGLGFMPHRDFDIQEEAKLLYVAMTRAMDKLLLTCNKESQFVSRIQQVSQAAKPRADKGIVSSLMGFLGR
jgi:hypothetical protein